MPPSPATSLPPTACPLPPLPPTPQLSGTLPAAWAAEGSFTVLHTLTLNDNRFTGGLPDEWSAFLKLESLNASAAGLGGPLPEWGPGPATLKSL